MLRHERSKKVAWICIIILFTIILYNFNTDYSNSQRSGLLAKALESIKQRRSSQFKVVTFQMYEWNDTLKPTCLRRLSNVNVICFDDFDVYIQNLRNIKGRCGSTVPSFYLHTAQR